MWNKDLEAQTFSRCADMDTEFINENESSFVFHLMLYLIEGIYRYCLDSHLCNND